MDVRAVIALSTADVPVLGCLLDAPRVAGVEMRVETRETFHWTKKRCKVLWAADVVATADFCYFLFRDQSMDTSEKLGVIIIKWHVYDSCSTRCHFQLLEVPFPCYVACCMRIYCSRRYKSFSARWQCNWSKTAFSVTFDRNCRLLTGLKFLQAVPRPGFLTWEAWRARPSTLQGKHPVSLPVLQPSFAGNR